MWRSSRPFLAPETATMTQKPIDSHREELNWLQFIALGSEEGRRWSEEYRQVAGLDQTAFEALLLLRQRQLEAGHSLLEEVRQRLGETKLPRASMMHVLRRWYFSVIAYYYYCRGDFDLADEALAAAADAIRAAIEEDSFLLPLANFCHEFSLQRIRIAKNRNHFEVKRSIQVAQDMLDDRLPLCVLQDGTAINFSSLGEFYSAVSIPDEHERGMVQFFVDRDRRLRNLDRFIASIFLTLLVIQYP